MSHLIKNIVISIFCCNCVFATEVLLNADDAVQSPSDQVVLFERDSPQKKSKQEAECIDEINTILSDPFVTILDKKYPLAFGVSLKKALEAHDDTVIVEVLRQIDRLKERTKISSGVEEFLFELYTIKGEKTICVSALLGENAL